jgi:Sulfotransferase domain
LEFDDVELESKLVWIWGSPRTGSTWLLEMLCHPLKVDPKSDVGFRWREGWEGEASALPVNEFLITSHIVPGNGVAQFEDGIVLPKTLNSFSGSFSSYAFSTAYEDVWRPEVRRLTLVRIQAVIERARQAGLKLEADSPLMVIKEVNGSHGADIVMSLFPRSKMIFLVRDGRDVLDSLLDANKAGGWLTKRGGGKGAYATEEERHQFVRENCLNWAGRMTICTRAYEAHDPALRRKIRYEDLLADTDSHLADLARWLELPGGPKRIQNIAKAHSFEAVPEKRKGPGKVRRSATPGSWREGLSPEDRQVAQEIMGDRLAELGYEP